MNTSTEIDEILKAIADARNKVSVSIHKGTLVGSGKSAYNSINDEQVRRHTRKALIESGLIILPVGVEATTTVDAWTDSAGSYLKRKYRTTTDVVATYKVFHVESGQWIQGQSLGTGVDQADKGAGKAQTYALKTFILDLFFLVKSKDEDGEMTHSEDYPAPSGQAAIEDGRKFISTSAEIDKIKQWIDSKHQRGCKATDLHYTLNVQYAMPKDVQAELTNYIKSLFGEMKN